MANEIVQRGVISRLLANARAQFDGTQSSASGVRTGPYNEQVVLAPGAPKQLAGDEGTVYMASLGAGATALQLGLSATYSATASAALVLLNTATTNNGPNCILDRIHMVVSGAPTSATNWQFSTVIDNVNRAPTTLVNVGGTPATLTAFPPAVVCTNMNANAPGVGKWYFPLSTAAGAPPTVPAAGGAVRTLIGNGIIRSQIPVVGDDYTIAFGMTDEPSGFAVTAAPAGYSSIKIAHPAVSIGPGQSFVFYMWGLSNATAGIIFSQLDVSHVER